MVWNTTQSAFYKAVDAFNNGEKSYGKQPHECKEKSSEKSGDCQTAERPENKRGDHRVETDAPQRVLPCGNRCPCQRRNSAPLSDLFSDKDMLLIAGLILFLSQQNADKKLILALAFILLS